MSVSLIIALVVALVLFWAVGAYSRLMRLRAAIVRAFAALDNVLAVQPALIQATLPTALAESASTNDAAEARTSWSRLARTGHQYSLALAAARQYPLDAANMVGLSNAQETLRRAWQEQGDSGDGNEALPESVRPDPAVPGAVGGGAIPFRTCSIPSTAGHGAAVGLASRVPGVSMSLDSVPLWRQLSAAAQVLAGLQAGRALAPLLERVQSPLRPGVQALTYQALRCLGRAQALRQQLARRAPPPDADALLCLALALVWQKMHPTSPIPWSTRQWRLQRGTLRHAGRRGS